MFQFNETKIFTVYAVIILSNAEERAIHEIFCATRSNVTATPAAAAAATIMALQSSLT